MTVRPSSAEQAEQAGLDEELLDGMLEAMDPASVADMLQV